MTLVSKCAQSERRKNKNLLISIWRIVFRLEHDCKEKVKQLIEDEEEHVELNPYVMEHCKTAAEEFCSVSPVWRNQNRELIHILLTKFNVRLFICCVWLLKEYMSKKAGEEELLDCLIKSKPLMDQKPKCAAAVTHFQLITMKSMQFNKNFRESCTGDIQKYCKVDNINEATK